VTTKRGWGYTIGLTLWNALGLALVLGAYLLWKLLTK
jgi:hypothetical protein